MFENPLTGKLSAHIPRGSGAHFAAEGARMRECAERAGEYRYIYDWLASLCDVLAVKAELGHELYEAYQSGDRETLAELGGERIDTLKALLEDFKAVFRERWLRESKSFGFDVMDIRIGGLAAQLDTAQYMIKEYLEGRLDRIEELEAERLPYGFGGNVKADGDTVLLNRWERIAGQVVSNMYGY